LSNFFFARNDTKTPFYISTFIVLLNVIVSVSLFSKIGFIIIPIATSLSTWIGVILYFVILNTKKFLVIEGYLIKNISVIIFNTLAMSGVLIFLFQYFDNNLSYAFKYKSIFLITIISFAASIYLILCKLSGLLKTKNFKTN